MPAASIQSEEQITADAALALRLQTAEEEAQWGSLPPEADFSAASSDFASAVVATAAAATEPTAGSAATAAAATEPTAGSAAAAAAAGEPAIGESAAATATATAVHDESAGASQPHTTGPEEEASNDLALALQLQAECVPPRLLPPRS